MAHYSILKKLYESSRRIIFKATDDTSGRPVILKSQKSEQTGEKDFAGLQHEFDIIGALSGVEGVIHAYEVTWQDGLPTMAVEETEGISLAELIRSEKALAVSLFLELACSMARVLGKIHKAGIVHRDIKPSNILVSPDKKHVYFIDFHLSSTFLKENSQNVAPDRIEGTLVYISPEQTGRMNRSTDYRTDFYSLGITFYQMLTGRVPFESDDALELVYSHIAHSPEPPHLLKEGVPEMLSKIILKLLAKTAEERYRSAEGLFYDLDICSGLLKEKGEIALFEPGLNDRPVRLEFPEILYGRDSELKLLFSEYRKTTLGVRRILFFNGEAGIGKSFLIKELRSLVYKDKGYFISGKYDQYERSVPYNGLIQALRSLVKHILTESSRELEVWKEKILKALDENGKVITQIVPEIELIIGAQPDIPELGAMENQRRFYYVFQNFIRIFNNTSCPFVLFLDDLQWIDDASLQLLKVIVAGNPLNSFFLIGAYRDAEVSAIHPLTSLFDFLENEGIDKMAVPLDHLKHDQINLMIAHALTAPPEKTEELTGLIIQKTEGNPFFTKQFLLDLFDRELVHFYAGHKKKDFYDLKMIEKADITDNVVELMTGRMKTMGETNMAVLKAASCFGAGFTVEELAPVLEKSESEVTRELKKPVNHGILIKQEDRYLFSHDRVQEAAYSLLDEEEKKDIHYKIGKALLGVLKDNRRKKKLFELVDHLNKASDLISTEEEKTEFAWLNLEAGIRARNETALDEANRYFDKVFTFLPAHSWKEYYEQTFTFFLKAGETCYLTGDIDRANFYSLKALSHARSAHDKIKSYELIILNVTAYNPKEAVRYTKDALKVIGMALPAKPFYMPVILYEFLVSLYYGKKMNLMSFIRTPGDTDYAVLSLLDMLTHASSCLYFSDPIALFLLEFRYMNIISRKRVLPYLPILLMAYCLLALYFNKTLKGYSIAKVALKIQDHYGNKKAAALIYYRFASLINHWNAPFLEGVKYCKISIKNGKRNGDFEYTAYSIIWIVWTTGFYDRISISTIKSYIEEMENLHIKNAILMFDFLYKLFVSFTEEPTDNLVIKGTKFDPGKVIPKWQATDNYMFLLNYYLGKLIQSYIFNRFDMSIEFAGKGLKFLFIIMLTGEHVSYILFHSLALLARYRQVSRKEQRKYMKQVKKNLRQLKKWAGTMPLNFAHNYRLVEAERAGIIKPFEKAIIEYDRAIELARKSGQVRDEAIANECAGRYCLIKKINTSAEVYLKRSHQLYKKWGALGKVKQLEKLYPELFVSEIQPELQAADQKKASVSDSTTSANLDISTLMKAANTISSEIEMNTLLSSILTILVENAGAEKGALLLTEKNEFVIEAEFENGKARAGLHSAAGENGNISPGIIRYAANTKEPVVLDNAREKGLFTGDSYIADNNILSVLCLPIINQTRLAALLYLENNLTTGAFSPDRVETLKLLSTQAAISIDNARMYKSLEDLNKNLESKVEERTAELKQEKELKTRFFINLAHETKTPLTLITNYLDSYIKSQGVNQDLLIIKQNIDKLKKDMLNFLDSEKIELGKIEYDHNQVFNFSSYLTRKVQLFKETAGKLSIRLEETIEPGLFLKADPDSLDRIVNNLLDNALKFTKSKGKVTVSLTQPEETKLLLLIGDTGMGMSEKQADDIFKPFVQISRKKESRQGIGMGLFIVKSIVDSIGGSIRVETEKDKGTTFFITVPGYVPGENEQITDYQTDDSGNEVLFIEKELKEREYDPEKASLLIVEDNKNLLSYLQTSLFDLYNVFYALNGSQALVKLETIPAPDVIISDIMMEKMDGLEFLKTLSEKPEFNDIPFIFLTAKTTLDDKITGIKQGAVDYLFKPFSLEELKAKLQIHILNRQRYYDKLIKIVEEKIGESGEGQESKVDFVSLFEQKAAEVNLTVREKEILLLLLNAKEYKEIAWELDLKLNTVRFHIKNIYKKFNMRSKGEIFSLFKIS